MGFELSPNQQISPSTIRGYGNSFWMDVVEMVAMSSLLGSPKSLAGDNRILIQSDRNERVELCRRESRAMFALADTATSDEARREFLKLATEWLRLASELSYPLRRFM
jgi:hypothetical protein